MENTQNEAVLEALKAANIPDNLMKYINASSEADVNAFVTAAKESGIDFAEAAKKSEEKEIDKALRKSMGLE